jgi:hypothetical protein
MVLWVDSLDEGDPSYEAQLLMVLVWKGVARIDGAMTKCGVGAPRFFKEKREGWGGREG